MENRTQRVLSDVQHEVRLDIYTGYSLQKKPKQCRCTSHLWICLLSEKWACGTLWCLTTALVFWIPLSSLHFIQESKGKLEKHTEPKPLCTIPDNYPGQQFQPSQKVAWALENNSIKQNKFKTNIWRWNMQFILQFILFPECSSIYFTGTCGSVTTILVF